MRFKAILPVILAVFLVGNGCFAYACQITCEDAVRSAGCHAPAAAAIPPMASGSAAMAGMRHCAMCVVPASALAVDGAMSCSHAICAVQPVMVERANVELATELVALPLVGRTDAASPELRAGVAEPPPLYRSTGVSLHTILRI